MRAERRRHRVQRYHGGLTPPAPGAVATTVRRKNDDIRGTQTHVHKSGGRQPAVGVGNTFAQTQTLLFGRPPTVDVPMAVAFALIAPTGGLRPPLLCCNANVLRRKNDFCGAQTHAHKSGGRQPAVGVSNAVAIANAFVQRGERQPAVVCEAGPAR
jgi:hypothetical protein